MALIVWHLGPCMGAVTYQRPVEPSTALHRLHISDLVRLPTIRLQCGMSENNQNSSYI